ncbi:MAG: DUF1467 family protein [Alphaproteobacteria bacterium]
MIAIVSIFFSYLVYFVTIWVGVFFMCLPLFKPTPAKKIIKGNDIAAPENPQMKKKFFLSIIISLVILIIVIILQKKQILPELNDLNT